MKNVESIAKRPPVQGFPSDICENDAVDVVSFADALLLISF